MTHGDEVLRFRRASDEDERLLQQTYLEQSSQRLLFETLVAALSGIVHVHMVSQLARPEDPAKRDAPDFDLIEQLASMSETQQIRALHRIQRLLRIAVPKFSDLRLNRDESGRPHLEARYENWREGWQNEQEFSDGTLRCLMQGNG
ncbi:MAG: hypothetical protein ABJC13_17215 [Acidobacteriota bacterium]